MWRANPKAWDRMNFFVEWIILVFCSGVGLDNAPTHPSNLEDDLLEEFKYIKFPYLPPNTTPILQPMDQQEISNFKNLYTKHIFRRCFEVTENTNLTIREFWKNHFNIVMCLRIIVQAWLGVTTSAWKKLWPEAVAEREFEGLEPKVSVVEELVSLGKSMSLEVEERDVNELVEEQSQELTTEELHDLHLQQHTVVQRKISFEEEPEMEEVIPARDIKQILRMWDKVVEFVDKNHREKVATSPKSELFNETCLTRLRNTLTGRKKQTSLDSFFKRSAGENEQIMTKRAKTSDKN